MMTYADLLASADTRAWQNQAWNQNQAGISNNQWQQQFDWQKRLGEAAQTGMWNGQWSNPQEQWFTGQFGQWYGPGGAPAAGAQTLAAQQQQFGQGLDTSQLYGQYYAPGTAPTQGQQTLAAQQQGLANAATVAGLTGMYNAPGATGQGTQTLAGQQQQWQQGFQQQQFAAQQAQLQQQNALGYLQLLSSLRGPADWAKYQQVLGSTPGGMRDLAAAAMGQYVPGGGATTGVQPQAANLNSMYAQVQGSPNTYAYPQAGQNWAQQQAAYQQNPPNWQTTQYSAPQSQQAWGTGIGVGGNQATAAQAVQATGNGTNMYGGQQQQYNLPAPNQISSQSWNNFTPSQQQMLMGQYESAGWDKGDVQSLYNQSLPKYGTNNASAGTWRLR
jgi:hypothetical protein